VQQHSLHFSSAILQVARLTNSSLLGETGQISGDGINQRAGRSFNASRNPDSNQHFHGSQANIVLDRNGGRDHRGSQPTTIYPLSIRNLDSFSVDSNSRMFDSNRNQSSGLSSLIPNPPDALSGELEDRNRTVNVHGNEGVSGQDAGVL
jgi:hypothetical protein